MEENSLYILIGAVFGVLSTLVPLVATDLWTHTLLPLLRRWRYQGVNIAGEWKGLGTGHPPVPGEWSEVALSLKQNTRDLQGLMTIRYQSAAHSFDLNLQLAGRISDGYITLSPSPAGKADTAAATALLKIDAGAALNGQLLYRHPVAGGVEVINMSVYRAESMAMPRLRPAGRTAPAIQLLPTGAPLAAAAGGE